MADVDKDVSGGIERKAAAPEPAGVLNAHAEPWRQGSIRPAQRPQCPRRQLLLQQSLRLPALGKGVSSQTW